VFVYVYVLVYVCKCIYVCMYVFVSHFTSTSIPLFRAFPTKNLVRMCFMMYRAPFLTDFFAYY
jgi:hypothetical protein